MITFKLAFLLPFCDKPVKEKAHKPKKEKKAKQKIEEVVEDPKYLIRTDKIVGTAHIEYELVPNKCRYQIDVICWTHAAKIFSVDGCRTLKTVLHNDQIWVPVCIEHYLPPLAQDEILALHKYVVQFSVFTDKARLGSMAKSDKTEILYMREEDVDKIAFVDLFVDDPNTDDAIKRSSGSMLLERHMREIIMKCVNFPDKTTVSWLYHRGNFDQTIMEIIETEEIPKKYRKAVTVPCCIDTPEDMPKEVKFKHDKKKDKASKTKEKKHKKEKKPKKVNSIVLPIQAEIFFTDPDLSIFKIQNNAAEITQLYVLITVTKLLTKSEKLSLNPMVVKIKRIGNFPVKIAKEAGIEEIFCKYNIPHIVNCQSLTQPLGSNMYFNESHIHFTNVAPKIKLLEFALSKRFLIEIYGIKKLTNASDPRLFGKKHNDKDISKINPLYQNCQKQTEEVQTILLAVASFDISSLINNVWLFKEKGQLHSPQSLLCQKQPGYFVTSTMTDVLNVNEINLKFENYRSKQIILDGHFIEHGSILKVEMFLLAPQAAALTLHQVPNTYKRLFIVFYSEFLAKKLLKLVEWHNEQSSSDIMTGFLLDNGNHFAFYIEGLSTGYILNIWNEIHLYEYDFAKMFFNTDSAYEKRLYSQFIEYGGLYVVVLKIPLGHILADKKIYIIGNIPEPCRKALSKFNLLFNSRTLQSILQYELFPKPEELISLNIEYGVPRRWNIMIHGDNAPRTSVFLPFLAVSDSQTRTLAAPEEIITVTIRK